MKEFIDKLIERLEEVYAMNDKSKKSAYEEDDWEKFDLLSGRTQGIDMAISIANKLAEEYKGKNIEDSYISRTEVLKLIEDIKCDDSLPKNYGTLLDIMRQIRNMPTVSINNGWIPCSERLPNEYDFVLCYGKNREGENKYEVSVYVHEINCWMCSRIADVIAWQPLPAPYTEGE